MREGSQDQKQESWPKAWLPLKKLKNYWIQGGSERCRHKPVDRELDETA